MLQISNPKVSIIIPVYNGSNYLKEAIDSALAQTYKNVEIIVVNDGSNDNGATEKIAKYYGKKIKYYKKTNCGVATALNYGIEKMTGEYFSWLSHDDIYEKNKIEDQVRLICELPEASIVASNVKVLYGNGIKRKTNIDRNTFEYADIFLATSAEVGLNGCTLLIPKNAFSVCGTFDENLPVTQDYDLWFRLKEKYKFVLLNKYLVISRNHAEQDSVIKNNIMKNDGDKLHYKFLIKIPYERFENYFKQNKSNIIHTYNNYKLYKMRGYQKTASMIIKNILRYYYENDIKQFYKMFYSEIRLKNNDEQNNLDNLRNKHLIFKKRISDQQKIDINNCYQNLLDNNAELYPIKYQSDKSTKQQSEVTKTGFNRVWDSMRRDGIYLTIEKMARVVLVKTKKLLNILNY